MSNYKKYKSAERAYAAYEMAKEICISLGTPESNFAKSDEIWAELIHHLKNRVSGGLTSSIQEERVYKATGTLSPAHPSYDVDAEFVVRDGQIVVLKQTIKK